MKSTSGYLAVAALFVLPWLVPTALAESPDANVVPGLQAPAGGNASSIQPDASAADSFGPGSNLQWIAATKFHGVIGTANTLVYESFNHFQNSASATPQRFFAQADVPPGSLVTRIACFFRDASATNNLTFTFQRADQDYTGTPTRTNAVLHTMSSTGSAGLGFLAQNLPTPETILTLPTNFSTRQYYVTADVANDTSFVGCFVFYQRQISPAPAVATFADVPTTHPFFREIEALANSGITQGCLPAGNFCPGTTVTREQMAAFLSRALGLHSSF